MNSKSMQVLAGGDGQPPAISGPLSTDEVQALLAATAADPKLSDLNDAVELALHIGGRLGELVQLQWIDIDMAEQTIFLGSGARRLVPFDLYTLALFEKRIRREQPSEFVFGGNHRVVLNRISRQLQELSSKLGIGCTFHTLRCTFAFQMAATGLDFMTLCFILGCSMRVLNIFLARRCAEQCPHKNGN